MLALLLSSAMQTVSPMPSTVLSDIGAPTGTYSCTASMAAPKSAVIYIQRDAAAGQALWVCSLASDGVTYVWVQRPSAIATGQTAAIGGGSLPALSALLTVDQNCTSGTATIPGASPTTNTASANPIGNPGNGSLNITAYVSSVNTVTVKVCNVSLLTTTPNSVPYKVFLY